MGIGNDLDAEDICHPWSAVISKCTEDQILALLIEDQNAREHVFGLDRQRVEN